MPTLFIFITEKSMSGISFSYGWMQGLQWYRLDLFFSLSIWYRLCLHSQGRLSREMALAAPGGFLLPVDHPRENVSVARAPAKGCVRALVASSGHRPIPELMAWSHGVFDLASLCHKSTPGASSGSNATWNTCTPCGERCSFEGKLGAVTEWRKFRC